MKGLRNSGPMEIVRTLINANNPEITDTIEGGKKSGGKIEEKLTLPWCGRADEVFWLRSLNKD
jgi:hypothetical protein